MSPIVKRKGIAVLVLGLILVMAGCSKQNTQNSVSADTGRHYIAGWSTPDVHGAWAKRPSSEGGMASCQECHGDDFSGGISKTACSSCHGGSAPHPQNWTSGTRKHSTTDQSNAPVCAVCHTNGANSPLQPATPAAVGTPPGCFNNTLCHDQNIGHAPGWASPDAHGASAKSQATGFSGCKTCHGTDLAGSGSAVTCLDNTANCHTGTKGTWGPSPHAAAPWRASAGSSRTHTDTNEGNAAVCYQCHADGMYTAITPSAHTPGSTAPTCYNNWLCHGTPNPHLSDPTWSNAADHGAAAKSAPTTTQGFSYCQSCHGDNFAGGTTTTSCLNNCHGVSAGGAVNAPHGSPWTSTSTYKHSATNEGNAPKCGLCHLDEFTKGVGSRTYQPLPVGTTVSGCFDGRLCHAASSMGCVDCHSSVQAGTHGTPRDIITGASGEFGKTYGHKNSKRGTVTNADCIVCHLEGEYATQARSTTFHGDGKIDLRDPDGAGETPITDLSGASFTFTKFSMSFAAGSRTSSPAANSIPDVISRKFCLACHDGNGATNPTARADDGGTATAAMPFGGIQLGANYTAANGAIGTQGLVDVKTQFATTNSSYHPVLGPLNRDFPTATRMNIPYTPTGTRGTSGTLSASVVINCFDCHNVSGANPLTTRTVAAHGNAVTLRGSIYVNSPTLCTTCHAGYTSTPGAANTHGLGSAMNFSIDGGENMSTVCHNCHSSATTMPARPVPAQDYHGNNALVGGTLWPTINARPYAFIRNTTNFVYHRPYRGTETALQTGSATCSGGGTQNVCAGNRGTKTYTPGGSY